MKKVHAYTVNWRDSSTLRGWQHIDGDHSEATITTIGWLIKDTRDAVTITTSISAHGSVMDALTIPRVAITRMRKLRNYIENNTGT